MKMKKKRVVLFPIVTESVNLRKNLAMNLNDSVATIMTSDVVTIASNQKLLDLKRIYENQRFHHHVPVVDGHKVSGIVSLIDFMRVVSGASLDDDETVYHDTTVAKVMSPRVVSLPKTATIAEAAGILGRGEVRSVLILDGEELAGIITTADIIRNLVK